MTTKTFVRNIPFVGNSGLGFHFQKAGRRVWVEIPFVSITFCLPRALKLSVLLLLFLACMSCSKPVAAVHPHNVPFQAPAVVIDVNCVSNAAIDQAIDSMAVGESVVLRATYNP